MKAGWVFLHQASRFNPNLCLTWARRNRAKRWLYGCMGLATQSGCQLLAQLLEAILGNDCTIESSRTLKMLLLRAQPKSKAPGPPWWVSVERIDPAGASPRTQPPAPIINQSTHTCPNREPERVSSSPDDSNGPPRLRAVVLAEGNLAFPPLSSAESILSSTQIHSLISPGVGSQTFSSELREHPPGNQLSI